MSCFSTLTLPALGRMEETICTLERGTLITRLTGKRSQKPETRTLMLRRETRQLVWCTASAAAQRKEFEGSLELREVREVRPGKGSKDFDRWPDETRTKSEEQCFVLLYGSEFKLQTLSVIAFSKQECELWLEGLRYMVNDTVQSPYSLQIERWLRREFYAIETENETVTMKELRLFLARVNCKVTTAKLAEVFNLIDYRQCGELRFDDFLKLYMRLLSPQLAVHDHYDCFEGQFPYSKDNALVRLKEFQAFLIQDQNETMARDDKVVSSMIREFVQDPQRDVQEPFLTLSEYLDYLYSRQNALWDVRNDRIHHDMKQPLAHYWISSSHNTYLTGDQLKSESSTEAYVRALRMGCRCIELDCWDGPDNLPLIYHGHTLTSKIKFIDVIRTIRDHAFTHTEYPLILSIEQNCSLTQQRYMAQAMRDVFGDQLLSVPVGRNETELPSPHQLRRRIILKHKKLPDTIGVGGDSSAPAVAQAAAQQLAAEGAAAAAAAAANAASPNAANELSVAAATGAVGSTSPSAAVPDFPKPSEGLMWLWSASERAWVSYVCVLSKTKLVYRSEEEFRRSTEEQEAAEEQRALREAKREAREDELHFGENWFHGKLEGGRAEAERMLLANRHMGDGVFLIRESSTFVGDFSLSFLRHGKPNHVRIKWRQDRGLNKYFLTPAQEFDSLYALVMNFKKHPLRSAEFSIRIADPVPQPQKHESQAWFHPQTSREQATAALVHMADGSYLVRTSENEQATFTISFMAARKVRNCRINMDGRLFSIGDKQFETMAKLIGHYAEQPLYRNVKLSKPVSKEQLKSIRKRYGIDEEPRRALVAAGAADDDEADCYMDPSTRTITCKALYDYTGAAADELTFCKHAIITNVSKDATPMWYKGDYGGKTAGFFPANYVVEVDSDAESGPDEPPAAQQQAAPQPGSIAAAVAAAAAESSAAGGGGFGQTCDAIDITGASVRFSFCDTDNVVPYKLHIRTALMQKDFDIGFRQHEEAYAWQRAISESAQIASAHEAQRRKSERVLRVAKEMSDLIIYLRSVPFRDRGWVFNEMSSFSESKAEKYFLQQFHALRIAAYHLHQISRVYPRGNRFDSSNFNPFPFWNAGSQMCALNFQTGDKPMQYNQAKFRDNGGCGFLLKPKYMLTERFDPGNLAMLKGVETKIVHLRLIAARHLCKVGRNVTSPLVEVEVLGSTLDSGMKHRTRSLENGFNPLWNERCEIHVKNPYIALLRFEVYDEDMFGERISIGQATYPVNCLRTGIRSVALRNKYSEEFELAALLVHVKIESLQRL